MPHKDPEARRDYHRAYQHQHRDKRNARRRELWADPDNKRREGDARYVEENRESIAARKAAWYLANRPRLRTKGKAYQEANRERLLEHYRAYREANRDQLRMEYRQWRERHLERKREKDQLRRARKLGTGGGIRDRDWLRLLARHSGGCAYCGDPATEQDHVIPLSRGGRHTIGNVLPACGFCNRSKKDRLLIEWSGRKPLVRIEPRGQMAFEF